MGNCHRMLKMEITRVQQHTSSSASARSTGVATIIPNWIPLGIMGFNALEYLNLNCYRLNIITKFSENVTRVYQTSLTFS